MMGEDGNREPNNTPKNLVKSRFASIRENFKRISGYRESAHAPKQEADNAAQRKDHSPRKCRRGSDQRITNSFEVFLANIPRLDPVDRTVGWVLRHPEESETLNECLVQENSGREDIDYDTSISRCESARGTHGRGTPPTREAGQPRLDELFRKLQMKQEREARKELFQREGGQILMEKSNKFHPQPWMAKKSSDVVKPRKITGDILHKNSFYYNQHITLDEYHKPKLSDYCCEWRDCRAKFLSNKELLQHVQDDHVSNLPLYGSSNYLNQGQLTCQWRKCKDSKCYPARYKLLLHLQRCHCRERTHEKNPGVSQDGKSQKHSDRRYSGLEQIHTQPNNMHAREHSEHGGGSQSAEIIEELSLSTTQSTECIV